MSSDADRSMGRRDFAKAVGATAAIGGGAAAASGTASAAVPGMTYAPGAPTITGLLFAEALDSVGHNEDPTRDEITLHNQCTGAKAWWDATLDIIRDSRLEDASMAANIEARAAIADAWENNRSQSEARDDALQAIAEFFNTPAKNATETVASALAEIGYAAKAARADSDIDDRFVAFTIADTDYSGTGSVDGSGSQVNGEHVTHTVELPTGDTHEVDAPDLSHAWDNGDSITISLGDIQSNYSSSDEYPTLTTDDGNEVTDRLGITIMNVPEADLLSETVLVLSEWADTMDQISKMSSQARGNYDTTLIGKLYDALDAGDISPSDVRGVEGLAEHLSGSTDATSSRYQMALLNTLGLERNDLSSVSSMSVDYTGYTGQTVERENGKVSAVKWANRLENKSMEGQLFGDLVADTTLQTSQTYLTNETLYAAEGNTVQAIDATNGGVQWTYNGHGGIVDGIGVSPDGSTVYAADRNDELHAISAADGSQKWVYQHPTMADSALVDPDGSTVYTGNGNGELHAVSADGTNQWTYTQQTGTVNDLALSPDGGTIYTAGGSGEVHAVSADGAQQWTYTQHTDTVRGITISPDGETLYTASGDNSVHAINVGDQSQVWTHSAGAFCGGIDVSPDGSKLFVGMDSETRALLAEDGTQDWSYTSHGSNFATAVSTSITGETVFVGDEGDALHAISAADGSQVWQDSGTGYRNAVARRTPQVAVDGVLDRAIFFDAPNGEEYDLVHGLVTIHGMTDSEGNSIDEETDVSWDRPEHDSTDMSEYRTYVEETSEEHEDAIEAEEESGGVPSVQNPFSGSGGLLLLAAAAAAAFIGLNNN